MADYILVTLQNDMSEAELKTHCKSDLTEFFGVQTSFFVDTLFDALAKKQYLRSNGGDSATSLQPQQQKESRSDSINGNGGSSSRRRSRSPDHDRGIRGSSQRDRGHDRDRERRGGRSSRSPSRERRPVRDVMSSSSHQALLNGPLQPQGQQQPHLQGLQQQQLQAHQQQPQGFQQQQQRRRKPCFDFMRRGTCQRGDACTYAHVTQEQAQMMGMVGGGPMVPMQRPGGPFMMMPPQQQMQQRPPPGGGFYPMAMQQGPRPAGGSGGSGHYDPQQPQQAMSETAVFVTNIPAEAMDEGSVRDFFGRFGAIQDVRLDYARHSAAVEYGDSAAQAQALSTPEAVFGNRFVRVHKARQQRVGGPPASAAAGDPQYQQQNHQQQAPVWRPKSATIKKAEMIEKFVEQQKELMKKLTTIKDMPPATRKIIMDSIHQIQQKIDAIRQPPAAAAPAAAAEAPAPAQPTKAQQLDAVESEKQALQAKLSALQMEAARLGMARGGRGGSTAAAAAARGSMSLDKRPRTLLLRNVGHDAAVRLDSALARFGEIEQIDKAEERNDPPFTYTVRFKARWEAEAAMKAVPSLDDFADVTADWDQ
ncbi:hypothetical protein H4R26_004317 [Coemansia thaxteri]|uniref:C3H1-type domain-containing protein n=1 Tax=Coemansia thaxteri TaxID=2663907 RepID=A0A9W8BF50_9FUNG|nr:hypothetical protein H4R26_004317 [Coemansia thaxteri]